MSLGAGIAGFAIGGLFVIWLQVVGLAVTSLGHALSRRLEGGGSLPARPKAEDRVPASHAETPMAS